MPTKVTILITMTVSKQAKVLTKPAIAYATKVTKPAVKTLSKPAKLPVTITADSVQKSEKDNDRKEYVRQKMVEYRARNAVRDQKLAIVNHLCGDSVGQMRTRYLRGFLIIESNKLLDYLTNTSFRSNKLKHMLRDIIATRMAATTPAPCGYVGVVSMELMVSLVGDLRSCPSQFVKFPWHSIQRYRVTEGKAGKAEYFMFHWQQNSNEQGSMKDGYVPDWKIGVKGMRTTTQAMIDLMARNIIRGVGGSPLHATDEEVDQVWAYFPGLVRTGVAYNQSAHLDMGDKTGYIVHMPLTYEGMVLMVIPRSKVNPNLGKKSTKVRKTRKKNTQAVYMFIPYGTYLVLPSTVNHAGVYGSPGNLRFHMAIRLHEDGDWGKDSFKFDAAAEKHNSDPTNFKNASWKTSMTIGKAEYSEFTASYTQCITKRFGMLLDKNWMNLAPTKVN